MEKESKPKTKSKNRNSCEYIRNYMRQKYLNNPLKCKKYQKSCIARRKYTIPDAFKELFGNDIHHIIKIHHLIKELEPESLNVYMLQSNNEMAFCDTHNNTTD